MKLAVLSLSLSLSVSAAPASPVEQPVYPLSAIVQNDPRENIGPRESLTDILAVTRMAYNDDGLALRATLAARHGAKPPLIAYMGGFTTNHDDILWLEKEFRHGVAMVDAAKLGSDIDAKATELVMADPRDGELAIVASTADGVDPKDRTRYAFWIRVDDELMKVKTVDAKTGKVTVERGFDRSKAVAHRAGAVVLSPVYLGDRARPTARASSSWPGATSRIRYALNPLHPEAQAYKARCVVEMMKLGYDGAWWDTFQPQPFNLCDALGRKIDFSWDYTAGRRFDFRSSLEALKVYTRKVRALVKEQTGREPVLYGNSVSGTYARGSRELLNSATVHDLLDGYCFEDSYLDVKPTGGAARPTSKTQPAVRGRDPAPPMATYEIVTGRNWLRNVTGQADAARSGLHALCMAGAAGYLGARLNPSLPDYDDLIRYSYASYLLTVTSERATSFGLPLLVQVGRDGAKSTGEPWPRLLYAPIGEPAQSNEIESLRIPGTSCFAREFTNGFVAVYPEHTGNLVDLKIPPGLVDAQTGSPVEKLQLKPGGSAVLVRR